jgi:sulfur carrier protein
MPVRITLNGEERRLEGALTVAQLLELLGLAGHRVAVEVNHEIVPHSRHGEHTLRENDRVEVVRAIGGGSGMMCKDARIQRRAGCAMGARGAALSQHTCGDG